MTIYYKRDTLFARVKSKYRIKPLPNGWFAVLGPEINYSVSNAVLAVAKLRELQKDEGL